MGGVSGFPPSTTSPGRPRLRLLSCLVRSLRHVTCTLLVSSKSRNGIDLDVNGALAMERKTPSRMFKISLCPLPYRSRPR